MSPLEDDPAAVFSRSWTELDHAVRERRRVLGRESSAHEELEAVVLRRIHRQHHLSLCEQLDADGLHVGGTDQPVIEMRARLGAEKIVGASCYGDLQLARDAASAGASYVAFGACFDSPTKPAARKVSLQQLADFRQALGDEVAICGIGGITLDNVEALEGKVNAVALISELFGTPNTPATPEHVRDRVRQFMAEPLAA